jgi:hypothetical protein
VNGRRQRARSLLLAGGVLAIAAGLVQATTGSRIPVWTGDKADPGPLGLLTVVLGIVALVATMLLTSPHRSGTARAGAGAAIALVAIIGSTTVGRLWWLPGPLLVVGLAVSVEDWRALLSTIRRQWCRVLLVTLGCCELLVVVRAQPLVMLSGLVAGVALMAAAVPGARPRIIPLAVLGTLPFAALAWTALVPVIVSVTAAVITLAVHRPSAAPPVKIEMVR